MRKLNPSALVTSFKLRSRARHVYSEASRVDRFEDACRCGELGEMGRLMFESHRSCSEVGLVATLPRKETT